MRRPDPTPRRWIVGLLAVSAIPPIVQIAASSIAIERGAHNSYYLWSAGHRDADVLIAVGANPPDLKRLFRESALVDEVHCEYCMSWRARMPIYVARQPIVPLNTLWARMRHYE
jgi:hypothetical protein